MSCCTSPASTHSTTSIVSSSVTRMPWMNLPFLPSAAERLLDLRAAAVHHHRVHADQLEQHHVLGEILLQRRVGHGVAAVLDDDGLAVELADVGQRLGQDLGLVARCNVEEVSHGGRQGAIARIVPQAGALSDQWRVAKANVGQRDKIRVQHRSEQAVSKRPPVGIENGTARLLQHRLPGRGVPLRRGPNARVDVGLALREAAEFERTSGGHEAVVALQPGKPGRQRFPAVPAAADHAQRLARNMTGNVDRRHLARGFHPCSQPPGRKKQLSQGRRQDHARHGLAPDEPARYLP